MTSPIAICFFGITRSLVHTLPSIEAHVLAPARARGPVRVYAHLFELDRIWNPRTGEVMDLDAREYRLLGADRLELEPPGGCLERWDFEALKTHGDFWNNDFASLRNLVHQQHSLHRVSSMVLEDGDCDIAVFVRPDLRYHDDLGPVLDRARTARPGTVFLPRWQPWFGYNDRFAIAVGARAVAAYGQRAESAQAYCRARRAPLHSERMLRFRLDGSGIAVRKIAARASRVRADGSEAAEDFSFQWRMKAKYYARKLFERLGLQDHVRRLIRRRGRGV